MSRLRIMTKLNLELVNHFVLNKLHLTDRSKIDDITQIAKDLVGLHATLPTTPYLSLFARTRKFTKEQFDKESYSELPHPDGWGFLRVLRTISTSGTGYFRFTFGCVSQITKKLFIARPPGIL